MYNIDVLTFLLLHQKTFLDYVWALCGIYRLHWKSHFVLLDASSGEAKMYNIAVRTFLDARSEIFLDFE